MSKEFTIKKNTDFLKTYLKSIAIFLPFLGIIAFELLVSKNEHRYILLILVGVAILLLTVIGIIKYINAKDKRYIIGNYSIQIIKNYKIESYEFSQLKKIKRASEKQRSKMGMDSLTLEFDYSKKIKIDSTIPFFDDFREYLKEVLISEGYYPKITMNNEI